MTLDALIDEVRRRQTPDEALHLTAIGVLADSDLVRFGDDQIALALAGWAAVRAEGATETYPTLSVPSLALARSGVALTEQIFRMLPEDDKANLVCIGFLGMVGERLGSDQPGATPDDPVIQPAAGGASSAGRIQPSTEAPVVTSSIERSGPDQAELPVFRLLLVVQAIAAFVFGVIPLLLPGTFASLTGYTGDDELIYRLAGAATTGYLVAAIAALTWRSAWLDVRIALVATLTFTTAAALGCLATVAGGDTRWVVIVVLLAAGAFAVIAAYWLRRDEGPMVPAGATITPIVKAILGLATLSAAVFGIMPLVAPAAFASLFGLVGTDGWIYRMAGAACLGYAVAGILEIRAVGLRRIAVQNLAAIAFNVGGAAAAWLALLVTGHGGLLAPVIAAAATTFAVLLTWIQRSTGASSAG